VIQSDLEIDQLPAGIVEQVENLRPRLRAGFLPRSQVWLRVHGWQEMALLDLPKRGMPRFQFDRSDNPLVEVLGVNAVLGVNDPVSTTLWWFSPNSSLPDDTRPVDLIGKNKRGVLIDAAITHLGLNN